MRHSNPAIYSVERDQSICAGLQLVIDQAWHVRTKPHPRLKRSNLALEMVKIDQLFCTTRSSEGPALGLGPFTKMSSRSTYTVGARHRLPVFCAGHLQSVIDQTWRGQATTQVENSNLASNSVEIDESIGHLQSVIYQTCRCQATAQVKELKPGSECRRN